MMPKIRRLHAGYHNQLRFTTVYVDLHRATLDEIRKFVTQNGIMYPIAIDHSKGKVRETFAFTHLPHGILVDKNGIVRWSGSLFTHDAVKVLHRYYGKPDTATEAIEEPRIVPTRESPESSKCVGGVCRMPARKAAVKSD
jgi:hypothetical protein